MRVHRPTAILLVAALLAVAAIPWMLTSLVAALAMFLAAASLWTGLALRDIRRMRQPLICLECSRCRVPFDVSGRRLRCVECGLDMSFGRFITLARRAIEARAGRLPLRLGLILAFGVQVPILLTALSILRPGPFWSPMVYVSTLPALMLFVAAAQSWLMQPRAPDCATIERQWRRARDA